VARERTSVTRAVIVFTASSLLILTLVTLVGVLVLRRIAEGQAREDAQRVALVAGHGIVGPRLQDGALGNDGILAGNVRALLAMDELVHGGGLLREPTLAIQLVDAEGTIRYADRPELIGATVELQPEELTALESGAVVATVTPLPAPATSLGPGGPSPAATSTTQPSEDVLLVTMPVETPNGTPLLFRAWVRMDVGENVGHLWPVLAVALIALAILQLPFAYRLARSVRAQEEERERLLRRAIESSDIERRRIAADLHDGTIQQLAGLSMSLSAKADSVVADSPEAAASLRDAATSTRGAMRSLRSAVMGMSPPRLQGAGLSAALSDLVEPIADRTQLSVPASMRLPADVESLLFRAAQEALRNVLTHARAEHVKLTVRADDRRATLEVWDDGVGFSPDDQQRAGEDGHLGLRLLEDLATDADGTLDVTSAPGEGTTVHLEVPLR
jgi:signal transduction histidine kinase